MDINILFKWSRPLSQSREKEAIINKNKRIKDKTEYKCILHCELQLESDDKWRKYKTPEQKM